MRQINIGSEAGPLLAGLRIDARFETALLIAEIAGQAARAGRDLTERFETLPLEKQIDLFRLQLIGLHGILNCYGQKENRDERRSAYQNLIYLSFQFNYRLAVLRNKGVRDSDLTQINPNLLPYFRKATAFANRRPCAAVICPLTPGDLDHISLDYIQNRLERALHLINRGRLANLADNLLRRSVRSGKYKEPFIVRGHEDHGVVRRYLRSLAALHPARQPL